ncbi:multicopper oxidase domain-containing protein [Floridanema aerugineum]|uniref:Multicopper oxidase domain-containing protein n=1 Tax=Floridaenema aerugineum BLCC-F46 TaxID=3153654 RepID=A0ABV4X7J0_9CYAN
MTTTQLRNAYIIGQENFQSWSQGFDQSNYLRVLPHPDQKVVYKDPFRDWQLDRPGNYISSWGPQEELNATLRMENINQVQIDGFGILKSGDGKIPWLPNANANNQPSNTPYEQLRGYNGTIPGPFLITEPGDTLNLWLENNLDQVTNLHTHGLHVSPMGRGDNVLQAVNPGESWNQIIQIPDNHFIGPDWYHPHLHGLTNEQVSSGLAGQLLLTAPYNLPDLDKFNPKERPFHFMALNTFGVQQVNRQGSPTDPLNQNPTIALPAGTPLQVLGTENGQPVYELSDAVFMGYNAKPISEAYDPTRPTGGAPGIFSYGGGPLAEPVENVIHTVNGQYNPTIEVKTGEWNLFAFTNMNSNAFHIIQLFKEEGDNLIPQEVTLVAIDGDAAGAVASNSRKISELPVLSPGQRLTVQEWFEKPGKYYFLSNGTEEIIGNNTSALIKGKDGFADGHLIWGSQVLATVEVTGNEVPEGAPPEAYDTLIEQAQEIDEKVAAARSGDFDRQRTFTWSANLGNALAIGNTPDDLDVVSFEGTYRINGEYFATEFGKSQVPLAMPMLGTTEVWSMKNTSGQSDPNLPPQINLPLLEWHPFHIHQNDFTVLEINGIPVSQLKSAYLDGVLSDTIGLPPTYKPNTPTPENPYGEPMRDGETSEVKVVMEFEDFPGSYVNHCHILFHEDAGMMAPVRVVLNTDSTWLGLAGEQSNGKLDLYRASNLNQRINLSPYGAAFTGAVNLAIGDVNYKRKDNLNKNVTDNVTDIITIQSNLSSTETRFTIKVFDGQTLSEGQKQGITQFDGLNQELVITEFSPFVNQTFTPNAKASVAAGDINGDGFSDIIVGVGGNANPLIEVYSGLDYHLIARISPFHHETGFTGTINLTSGDIDGDNFDDVVVSQGSGGRGLVEVYSGRSIELKGSLNGKDTAHDTALLTNTFQPYGEFNGEIKVTSGYVLQRPDVPNGQAIQTYHANLTTMAVGNLPPGHEAVKIHTYLGGAHHDHAAEDHSHSSAAAAEMNEPEIRLDKEFTPQGNLTGMLGSFADINGLSRGEPVIFSVDASGKAGLIRLQEGNRVMSLAAGGNLFTSGNDSYYGDTGNNSLFGSSGNDEIYGLSGNDQINGNADNDTIFGGDDNDTLRGGKGNDVIYGNQGQDLIFGDLDNDTIYGGKGNDVIYGNQGQDVLNGNLGNDTIFGSKDNDLISGNQGKDVLFGDTGNDTVYGGQDDDLIYGNLGQDSLFGDAGNDTVYGGQENDTLNGGTGDDWLRGDLGNDVLQGGEGSDRFILAANKGSDTIVDFQNGTDSIILTGGLTFAQLTIAESSGSTLIRITSTNELLATLSGIPLSQIGVEDFIAL